MKHLRLLPALLLVVVLNGCSVLGAFVEPFADDASPREMFLDLSARYEPIQVVAELAVTSSLLAEKPDVKGVIKTVSGTATAAVLRFDDVTRGCLRDEDGNIVAIEGRQCEPELARQAFPIALAAIVELTDQLNANGFVVKGVTQ